MDENKPEWVEENRKVACGELIEAFKPLVEFDEDKRNAAFSFCLCASSDDLSAKEEDILAVIADAQGLWSLMTLAQAALSGALSMSVEDGEVVYKMDSIEGSLESLVEFGLAVRTNKPFSDN
tara:strand:- start:190 stop:555 length:366 start_codon:yes stop_codon:yes gene_type:complete